MISTKNSLGASNGVKKNKIVVVLGPTASGKSELAIRLAKCFSGEIVSADSRQVYRGMTIGTAKSSKKDLGMIRHHLVDIKNPNQNYTVSQYKKDSLRAICGIIKKGKLPILAGGTGLYIDVLTKNLEIPNVQPNAKLRKKLEEELARDGLKALYEKLVTLDPEAAYIVDHHNPRRVIRALEIVLQTNKPLSAQRKKGEEPFDSLFIGISLPSLELKERIFRRVDMMIQDGLVEEVEALVKKYGPNQTAFDAIGYREIIRYSQDATSLDTAIQIIKRNTWHYAKRQMTWFKRDANTNWVSDYAEAEKLVREFLRPPSHSFLLECSADNKPKCLKL